VTAAIGDSAFFRKLRRFFYFMGLRGQSKGKRGAVCFPPTIFSMYSFSSCDQATLEKLENK